MTDQKAPRTLTAEDFHGEAKVSKGAEEIKFEWYPTEADYRSIPLFRRHRVEVTVTAMPDGSWASDVKGFSGSGIHHATNDLCASIVEAVESGVQRAVHVVNVEWKEEYERHLKEERRKDKANQEIDAFLKNRLS